MLKNHIQKQYAKVILILSVLSFPICSNAQKWNANKPSVNATPKEVQTAPQTTYSDNGYSKSIVNVGAGFGTTYGGLGVKVIAGYKNSGVLVGLGSIYGLGLGYAIGGQISAKWWYASITYGTYLTASKVQFGNAPAEVTIPEGVTIMTGGMINLGKPKRCFLDLGIGLSLGGSIKQYKISFYGSSSQNIPIIGGAINIGFGVRLGNIEKK